jgi:hypothetical protein
MGVRRTAAAWAVVVSALIGWASGASPPKADNPLFLVGTPDASAAEFGLVSQGYAAFAKVFADPVVYTVGQSKPSDWPFVHPSHRDKWAGSRAHTFQIRFHSEQEQSRPLYLAIGVVAAHASERSRVTVAVNGTPLAEQLAPGTGRMEVVFDPSQPGAHDRMLFEVPAGLISQGENTISIRLDEQSWILYDYVALSAAKKPLPLVAPPEPELLADFLAGPMAGVDEIVFALRQPGKDGHWYANFGYYADDDRRLLYGDGGRLCRLNLRSGEMTVLVDDPAGGVRDPAVHYGGERILFSYRPGGTPYYHLYEIHVDGSGLRQLTDGPFDDIEPTWLPDGGVMFVSSRCKRWVNCWLTHVAVLHRAEFAADAAGPLENIRAISANVEHDNTPWVLPDGRVLYQRWEYVDRSQVDYHHLWTTNPDGSGQMIYYGNMHPATVMIDAKPIPGTKKVVAIFSPGHGRKEHDGALVVLDPSGGPDDRELARFIRQDTIFRDPWAFGEEAFMAARGGEIVLVDGRGQVQTIYRPSREEMAAGLVCHEPRPIIASHRERVVPPRTQPEKSTGRLALMDVYQGRNMEGVQRGEIKKLLVLESLPKPINFTGGMDPLTYGGSFTLERVLGTVPVEKDGSAYIELPALRSLFFVALDENDLAVKRMQSFLTVQPGEVTGCVGCHEQRTQSFIPGAGLMATRRAPSCVEPISDCPDVLDFVRDVQPVLDRLCIDCHGYEKTARGGPYAGRVILSGARGPMFSHSYFTLTVRQLFSDGRDRAVSNYPPRALGSSASRILKMIDGSHYGAVATEHEARLLRLWIEVGAPYPGTYAALGSGSIGGYAQNQLVNTDTDWPTTKAGADVIARRCAGCHKGNDVLPRSMSDERGVSFWRFDPADPRLKHARHIVFNLSRPEKSLLVLAPLAETAGGFGLCRTADGQPATVFADQSDADYRTLVAMAAAGRKNLEEIKRFDMPGFRPRPEYVREMKRFGILPPDQPLDAEIDGYAADRAYWQSLWYEGTIAGAE